MNASASESSLMEELLAATSSLVTSSSPRLLNVRRGTRKEDSMTHPSNIDRSISPTLAALSKPESRLTPILDARPHSIKARQRLDASEASSTYDVVSSDEETIAVQRPQPVKVTLNVELDDEAEEADALPSARLSTLKPSVLHSSAFHSSSSRPPSSDTHTIEVVSPLTPGIAAARALLATPPPRPRSSLLTPTHVLSGGFNNTTSASSSAQAGNEEYEQTLDALPRSRTLDSLRSAPTSSAQWARTQAITYDHGPRTSVPPAFFTQSFPDLVRLPVHAAEDDRSDMPPREGEARVLAKVASEPREGASCSGPSESSASVTCPKQRQHSPKSLKAPAFLTTRQASTPSAQLSTTASQPIRLHGNARAARAAATATNDMTDGDEARRLVPELGLTEPSSPRLRLLATRMTDEAVVQDAASDSSSLASLAPSGTPRRRSNSSASSFQFSSSAEADTTGSGRFVRDVRVAGWRQVGAKARGHVVFEVRLNLRGGTSITIYRRFSSFVNLRAQLVQVNPVHSRGLPVLPPRTAGILHKYASNHLEERRVLLQRWLRGVMLDTRWGGCETLREWCVGSG